MKEWRCTYRLSIPKEQRDWSKLEGMEVDQEEDGDETSSLATDSKVVLCAFGNVTNSTQEDWNEVELSLVPSEITMLATSETGGASDGAKAAIERARKEEQYSRGGGGMQVRSCEERTA